MSETLTNFAMAVLLRSCSVLMLILAGNNFAEHNLGMMAVEIIGCAWNWEPANRRSKICSESGKKEEV